jgi:hypothetical protein
MANCSLNRSFISVLQQYWRGSQMLLPNWKYTVVLFASLGVLEPVMSSL